MSIYDTNADLPLRADIGEESDPATLAEWHEDAIDMVDALKSQLSAHKEAGASDPYEGWRNRVQTKLGYAATTVRRIERRMVTLGYELPLTVAREERERIVSLLYAVRRLRGLCDDAGIDHSHIRNTHGGN